MKKTIQHLFGDQATGLTAKFLPEVVEVDYIDIKTNVKNTKYVDYDSFFHAVNQQIKLKTGLIAPGVRFFCRSKNRTIMLVEDPSAIRELTFNAKNYRDDDGKKMIKNYTAKIPMPTILVAMSMVEGEGIKDGRVWCLRSPIRTLNDPVYQFPFGNSYGRDGGFCWGTSTTHWASITKVSQARSIFSLIYGSVFNSDLNMTFNVVPPMPSDKIKNILDFYKYLDGKDKFPFECLTSAGTVHDCLGRIDQDIDGTN